MKISLIDAVFASPENKSFRRSLWIIFVRCELIKLADSLTIFGGILSGPVAFFAFNSFMILFICSEVTAGMSNVFLTVFLLFNIWNTGLCLVFPNNRLYSCYVISLFSGLPSISGTQPEAFSTMLT